jgi:hypothetical protein
MKTDRRMEPRPKLLVPLRRLQEQRPQTRKTALFFWKLMAIKTDNTSTVCFSEEITGMKVTSSKKVPSFES